MYHVDNTSIHLVAIYAPYCRMVILYLLLLMTTIAEMNRRFALLNLPRELPVIIEDRQQGITDAVKTQLSQGTDGTGQKIQPEYASTVYALDKQKSNPAPGFGVPDLKLTGAFYSGLRLTGISQQGFTIDSADSKGPALEAKYGTPIYALSQSSWEQLIRDVFRPDIQQYITKITKLDFV